MLIKVLIKTRLKFSVEAVDPGLNIPLQATRAILESFYVDDGLPGADSSIGDNQKWCAFHDKSMKYFMLPLHTIRFIFRLGAISDLIFDNHKRSRKVNYFRFDTLIPSVTSIILLQ